MTQEPKIRRALISVSNKTGLIEFARQLTASGVEILATGGTAALLQEQRIPFTAVADYTQFPEMMDGRIKTLHPKIYAGLLRRPGMDDAILKTHLIEPIDLLVVNLYPFQETIARPGTTFENAIEQIDIGGPAMLRAAAKNHIAVTVIMDPADYPMVMNDIQKRGQTTLDRRRALAKKAFAHTAEYDQAIYNYLNQDPSPPPTLFPAHYSPAYQKKMDLRYGENPHQAAALYTPIPPIPHSLANAELLQGKALSFNNLLDGDAALQCVRALDTHKAGCAIIKHATPCAAAQADTLVNAYQQALMADPSSAFGGIIATNQPIDRDTATAILNQPFVEVILAPAISAEALKLFHTKPLWRILACGFSRPVSAPALTLRSIDGGLLVQEEDREAAPPAFTVATERAPTPTEWEDLHFAWKIVQFVKSNAIVYAKGQATLGIGGGQTSRVFSAKIAALKAEQMNLSLDSAVAASDAFFPFEDGLEIIAKSGIRAVIQPGGSKRDTQVIAAANHYGIAMVFTGVRHFRH